MQQYIEIITTSMPLTAIFTTIVGIALFINDKKRGNLKINTFRAIKILKIFILSALIFGLVGYIVGKIGLNSMPNDGHKAFCDFCTKVSIIMATIDSIILLVVQLSAR